jgi:TonB-dependent Receptor Plug Domain
MKKFNRILAGLGSTLLLLAAAAQAQTGIIKEPAPPAFPTARDSATEDTSATTEPQGPESGSAQVVDGGREAAGRTVNVRAKRKPLRVSGQTRVTSAEIKRMPGLAEPDVIRAVQALPGVVASSDFSTKLYVRGSSSDQNLVLFDNAVLYSPMHFGGIFSTFLADAVGGMEFYKGGFQPKYGNRLSSVLAVESKNGGVSDTGTAKDTWAQGTARVTTLSGSLETDGRKGDFSWVMAGRRTWIDQALEAGRTAGITDLKLPYYFYDTQGSAAYGHDGDTLRVSMYQGRDRLALGPVKIDWGNTAVPVNIKLRLSDRWSYSGTAAYSKFSQVWGLGDIIDATNSMEDWNLRQEVSLDAGAGHLVTLGGEFNRYDSRLRIDQPIADVHTFDQTTAELYAGYLQDRWVISPRHTITAGIRGYAYPELDETAWDPRASYTWRPSKDWRLDAHAGVYHQFISSIRWTDQETFNEFWYPAKGAIKPSHSTLVSAGAERSGIGPLRLRVGLEAYYKDIRDLPLYFPNRTQSEVRDKDSAAEGYQISHEFTTQGGYSAGAELTVARDEGALSGEASWGLSKAVLKQDDYVNAIGTNSFEPHSADWDQLHTVKAKLNVNWRGEIGNALWTSAKKGRFLRTSLQANYHTGLPYTAFQDYYAIHEPDQGADGAAGSGPPVFIKDNTYLRQARHNDAIRRDYFRLDATVLDWGREGRWRLYWTVLNITDNENVFLINFDTSKNPPEKKETYQIPLLPILVGYEFQF